MQEKDFDSLVNRYLNGEATPLEKEMVEAHVRLLEDASETNLTEEEITTAKDAVWKRLHPVGNVHRVHFIRRLRWVAAAVFIVAIAATWFVLTEKNKFGPATVAKADVKAPASNRAMVTLSNGQTVYLDSAGNGQLAMDGNMKLVKLADGQIAYSGTSNEPVNEIAFNTLTNPRGSKVIDIALSDGSHVWLNAASSIKYPVAFNGKNRTVEVNGEAYFEVTHNAAMPFMVKVNGETIEDLGTKFNVNSYDAANRTTLLEGSVKINTTILKPGEQYEAGKITEADLETVMAWKNGLFHFDQADIETVMKEVARWYDVEVVYESKPGKLFDGGASRTTSAAGLFRILEETGGVHFSIEGKKVIVRK